MKYMNLLLFAEDITKSISEAEWNIIFASDHPQKQNKCAAIP